MVESKEECERDPARSVCSGAMLSLWLRDYREKKGRNWEVLRKRGSKKKRRREEKRTRERESRQSWFSVTPPRAAGAIFNTQAYVLSNLSHPGF